MEDSEERSVAESRNNSNEYKPCVIANEPDRTHARYIIDEFKTKAVGSKEVPFEQIDLSLYKPKAKLVGFRTSENRLELWIQAITMRYIDFLAKQDEFFVSWEEIECYAEPGKPDKVKIIVKNNEDKLFVLTIFITTGRIQVQGSCYSEWATREFPLLMQMIKIVSGAPTKESSAHLLSLAQECLFHNESEEDSVENTEDEETTDDEETSDDEKDTELAKPQKDETGNAEEAKDNHVSFADILAQIESDFIEFKAGIENEIYQMKQSLNESLFIKDKLICLENSTKAHITAFDDRLYHSETTVNDANSKVNDLSTQIKKLQDCKSQMQSKQSQMKDEINDMKKENSELKKELFVLREIIQKHENALESEPAIQPETVSNNYTLQRESNNLERHENPALREQHPNSGVLILCDSNGKFIKTDVLCPDIEVELQNSYTLGHANAQIQKNESSPKTVVLHCGTNDLERMTPELLIKESIKLIESAQEKFPEAKVIYSSLLPRQDLLHVHVLEVNTAIERYCHSRPNVEFLCNNHISKPFQFHDTKHLNQRGFKFFAKNLKSAIYGTKRKRQSPFNTLPRHGHYNSPPHKLPAGRFNRPPNTSLAGSINQDTTSERCQLPRFQQSHPSYQNVPPTYASVLTSPGTNHQSNPTSVFPAPPMNFGNTNFSNLPVSLKTLIQQLQLFV